MKRRGYLGLLGAGVLAGCSGDGLDGKDSTDSAGASTERPGDGSDTADSVADPSTVAFSERWQEQFGSDETAGRQDFRADADGDAVFVGAESGFVALDLADGSRMWEKDEWGGFVDVHADSDGVIAYTQSFDIVSFEPSDGTEQWRGSTAGGEPYQLGTELTPSYFVAESEDGITVYERGSGAIVLDLDLITQGFLATDGSLVLLQSTEIVTFDMPSGSERWRDETPLFAGPVIDDGRIIGVSGGLGSGTDSYLQAVDLDSGTRRWSEKLGDVSVNFADISAEDGVATFISDPRDQANTLYGHDLDDGSQLWTQNVGRIANPIPQVTANGVVVAHVAEDEDFQMRGYNVQNGERLDATDTGFGVTELLTADRVFVELELQSATAYEF